MPWDGTELWVAPLDAPRRRRGSWPAGRSESIWQPEWSPDGALHFVSDRSGWWNLYRDGRAARPPSEAELGYPQWGFGGSTYAFLDGRRHRLPADRARRRAALPAATPAIGPPGGARPALHRPSATRTLRSHGERVIYVASAVERRGRGRAGSTPTGCASCPRPTSRCSRPSGRPSRSAIEFPSADGRTAHAFWYPPRNPDYEAPAGRAAADHRAEPRRPDRATRSPMFDPEIAFWTSRGIGVVDVNYGGSTGFGRAYRELLNGAWGDRGRGGLRRGGARTWPTRARPTAGGSPSAAAAPAATPRSARWPSTTASRPAPATTAWPTPRRSPPTRTSSSRATSTR